MIAAEPNDGVARTHTSDRYYAQLERLTEEIIPVTHVQDGLQCEGHPPRCMVSLQQPFVKATVVCLWIPGEPASSGVHSMWT
jgi:hypothetical protein